MLADKACSLIGGAPKRGHVFITNALRFFWVVVVLTGELGAFFWSVVGCRWPSINIGHKTKQVVQSTHVLLVADTQVQHPAVIAKGSWWASPLRRILFELNLRKSWHVTSRLQPDAVIFMGDMLANGKAARSPEEYEQAAQKFKSIFAVDPPTKVYYVPGNNDVGLGMVPAASQKLRSYYTKSFGPLNQNVMIQNHSFVILDAPGLVDEDYLRHGGAVGFDEWKPIPDGPVAFVKDVAEYDPGHVILLSHIPLSRAETADCGPRREHGSIRRGAGPGWQSMLGKQTTNFLLRNLQPLIVFSADNRDYCDYTHLTPNDTPRSGRGPESIHEVTVKSFAMSVHIRKPGFQLLSLVDPAKLANPDLPSFAESSCFLPDQYRIYTSFYSPLLCISLLTLLFLNFRKRRFRGKLASLPTRRNSRYSPTSSGKTSPNLRTPNTVWSPFVPFSPVSPAKRPSSPRGTLPSYLRTPHTQSGVTTPTQLLVASSRPGTPGPSSPSMLAVPSPFGPGPGLGIDRRDDDGYGDEDDTMYPAQYAIRPSDSRRVSVDSNAGGGGTVGAGWAHVNRHGGAASVLHQRMSSEDEYDMLNEHDLREVDQEAGSPRVHGTEFTAAPSSWAAGSSARSGAGKWSKSWTFVFRGRRRRITLGVPSWTALHNLLDLFGFGGGEAPLSMGMGARRGSRDGATALLLDVLSVFWPSVVVWVIINWTIL